MYSPSLSVVLHLKLQPSLPVSKKALNKKMLKYTSKNENENKYKNQIPFMTRFLFLAIFSKLSQILLALIN